MAKPKRPTWFKLYDNYDGMLEMIPSEAVGDGVKLAIKYLKTGELPDNNIGMMTCLAFNVFKQSVDDAYEDYKLAVKTGKDGARKKAENKKYARDTNNYTFINYDENSLPF